MATKFALSQGMWSGVGSGGSFEDDEGMERNLTREATLRDHLIASSTSPSPIRTRG